MRLQEFRNERRQVQDTEGHRRRETDAAARHGRLVADLTLDRLPCGKELRCVLKGALPAFGERNAARRAVQKCGAETRFETGNGLRHCCHGQAEIARCRRIGAERRDLGEDGPGLKVGKIRSTHFRKR